MIASCSSLGFRFRIRTGIENGDEVKRKFDLLTLEEKEIVRKALEEPYDKFISDELEKISQKVLAKD